MTAGEFGQRARDITGAEIELGRRYRDTISGFEGVATSDCRFLYGCNRVGLSGMVKGEPKDFVFDALGLTPVADEKPVAQEPAVKTGGARPTRQGVHDDPVTAPEKIEVQEAVELDPRVRRGAAFLDEWEDGWAQKIALSRFRLSDGCSCVLGQILGDFVIAGIRYAPAQDDFSLWCREHAFLGAPYGESCLDDWENLERDWVTLIRQRQAEHA